MENCEYHSNTSKDVQILDDKKNCTDENTTLE